MEDLTIVIASKKDFLRYCVKLAKTHTENLKAQDKLIKLMVESFDIGYTIAIEGKAEV